jgi:glycosyltransferase involved in cell wall biosynthesis
MDHAQHQLRGGEVTDAKPSGIPSGIAVTLLTGGSDRPYVFGLAMSLLTQGATIELIGSDELTFPEFSAQPKMKFLNLRGSTDSGAGFAPKIVRVLKYYFRLIAYAAIARPKIFHILWNNRFETFDRTLLTLFYKLLGKEVVLTAHNVNAARRDAKDTVLNRLTLRMQYHLADQIFVHTEDMKRELIGEFGVRDSRVTIIPFGINNAVPNSALSSAEAKQRLGIREGERVLLFFGRITPYKGLEYLIAAFRQAIAHAGNHRLIIAGRPDRCEEYWSGIRADIDGEVKQGRILLKAGYIPDEDVEVYFKAADALVLPYRDIYQSGVLFLGQSFGLPVLAADVGSLKDDIQEETGGYLFKPEDPQALAEVINRYFASDLYANLDGLRPSIRTRAAALHSWDVVSQMTMTVYARLLDLQVAVAPHPSHNPDRPEPTKETPASAPLSTLAK